MIFNSPLLRALIILLAIPCAAFAAPVGKITSLTGTGQITRAEQTLPLMLQGAIEQQDIIETSEGANVTIEFEDKSVITIGSEASLTIDAYVYNPNTPANNSSVLKIGSGFFRFVSGKMDKKAVKVNTPVSTIGIRGTEFFGEVKYNGETAVSLVQCCADVTNEGGVVTLDREGFYTEITSKKAKPSRSDFTPEHFYKNAAAQLGTSIQSLGLKELTPIKSLEEIQRKDAPADRKTFPHL